MACAGRASEMSFVYINCKIARPNEHYEKRPN